MSSDDFDDLSDEFRKSIETWEEAEPQSLFALLPQSGVSLPPPAELDDAQLTKKLWDVIHALALLGTFLHNTDHLSDRELYTELWTDGLREPAVLMPDNPAYAYHFDLVGSGSEEHMRLYMKYYASEEDRRNWLRDWPEDVLPDHEDPPHDRDRRLPTAEGRTDSPVM